MPPRVILLPLALTRGHTPIPCSGCVLYQPIIPTVGRIRSLSEIPQFLRCEMRRCRMKYSPDGEYEIRRWRVV